MKSNKFFGKKSALYALVMATAALGMASVNTTAQAAGSFNNVVMAVGIKVNNNTNGCVRVYTKSQHVDVQAHRSATVVAASGSAYMASVYKSGCGGQAIGNRWYTTNTSNTLQTWNIY